MSRTDRTAGTVGRADRAGFVLLFGRLRSHRGRLARVALWSLVEALPPLLSGLLVSRAVDRFLAGAVPAGLATLGALLVAAGAGAVATRMLFPALAEVVEDVRDAFVREVVSGAVTDAVTGAATGAPPRDTSGVARLTEQVQALRDTVFALLRTARHVLFASVAALAGLALLAPPAAGLCGLLVLVALALFVPTLPGLARRQRAVLLAGEDIAAEAGDVLAGLRDALACGAGERAVRQVMTAAEREAGLNRALARATAARSLAVFVGAQLPLVVLLVAAPWLLRTGRLTVGEVVGAATYLTVSLEPALRGLVGVLGSWGVDLVVLLRRLGQRFAAPAVAAPAVVAPPGPSGVRSPRPAVAADPPALSIEDLTFAYGPAALPIVRGLSLTVGAREHLAVVGPSGIGKSTLAGLMAGLLRPDSGTVRVGGEPVDSVDESDLRRRVGLIPQEAYVFAGTLRENLAYLAPDATGADLWRAAEAIGAAGLLDRLGGLDTVVGAGGVGLSHGERQLVALARVYLSPARVVILDEATSHLEHAAEQRVEVAFARRPGALIVIAHRMGSAHRADRVLLLDGGRAEVGDHERLLEISPLYRDLMGRWRDWDTVGPPATRTVPA